jgi:hypothetical protein
LEAMARRNLEVVAVVEGKVIRLVPEPAGKEFDLAVRERVDHWSA